MTNWRKVADALREKIVYLEKVIEQSNKYWISADKLVTKYQELVERLHQLLLTQSRLIDVLTKSACPVEAKHIHLGITINHITVKSENMAVTIPSKKVVRATVFGTDDASNPAPLSGIQCSSDNSTVLSVVPVTPPAGGVANQFDITTLVNGTANLLFSGVSNGGKSLNGTDAWTVQDDNGGGGTVVEATKVGISYGPPTDVAVS